MMHSTARFRPVTAEPAPKPVREAVADLVRRGLTVVDGPTLIPHNGEWVVHVDDPISDSRRFPVYVRANGEVTR